MLKRAAEAKARAAIRAKSLIIELNEKMQEQQRLNESKKHKAIKVEIKEE